jgi:hypothetical protein
VVLPVSEGESPPRAYLWPSHVTRAPKSTLGVRSCARHLLQGTTTSTATSTIAIANMNGYPPPPGPGMMPPRPSVWRTYTTEETGKPYYHNTVTNETTYQKPEELFTAEEVRRNASHINLLLTCDSAHTSAPSGIDTNQEASRTGLTRRRRRQRGTCRPRLSRT